MILFHSLTINYLSMRSLFTFAIALLITTASLAQQTADPAQDPTALGNAFFKALLDEDGSNLGKLLASNFSVISFDGNAVDGETLTQGVGGGYVVIESATVSNTNMRQYNSDAAVMTGNWKAKGRLQGQAFESSVVFSLMSAKQGGSWKIVHVQFTPIRQ